MLTFPKVPARAYAGTSRGSFRDSVSDWPCQTRFYVEVLLQLGAGLVGASGLAHTSGDSSTLTRES